MVPVRDVAALGRCRPVSAALEDATGEGAYCFTASQAGRLRARGFWSGLGVTEDPATGSAAAALGLYLSRRLGAIDFEITQGVEIERPSRMSVSARDETVRVGGSCRIVFEGRIESLP